MVLKALLMLAPLAAGAVWVAGAAGRDGPDGPAAAPRLGSAECGELERNMHMANIGVGDWPESVRKPAAPRVLTLQQIEAELIRHGCPIDPPDVARQGRIERMKPAGIPEADLAEAEPPEPQVSFEPGRPMVDLSKGD